MNPTNDQDVIETPTEDTIETSDTDAQDTSNNPDDLAAKVAELEEKNRKLYARLKREEHKPAQSAQPKADSTLSQFDMFALVKANVEAEDIAEITDYAKLKGLSIADALKTPVVKTILSEKKQERETAAATSVKGTARGTNKLSDDSLLAMARKGEMPDSDADIARLIALRKANR